ncbi:enediyne biosynthesis protein UnbU [Micromonospora sp. LOL_021]|uniref:enediyne biosynthesis protein UnbU n=1 Tax=Micromonospora sp. LOL_021 TaxID=3345417 RepID=UPI003A8C637A
MTSTITPQTTTDQGQPGSGGRPAVDGTTPTTQAGTAPTTSPRVRALRRFAISITVFNIVGHLVLGFEQAPITPILAVLVSYGIALLMEYLDSRVYDRLPDYHGGVNALVTFLLPAHIAGLACAMLLWGNSSLWPYIFAVTAANVSKYVVRLRVGGRLRHVLNPSNAGIALTLVLFPWVGIAPPYHFTNNVSGGVDWLLPLGVLMLGTMLNAKLTRRLPLILAWAGGFVAQALLRWLLFDHNPIGALLPMTGLAFILFTNYMITDPGTTPHRRRGQIAFGLTAAAVYGVLVVSGISFGLFFALVITCGLRGLAMLAGRLRHSAPAEGPAAVPGSAGTVVEGRT